MKYKNSEDFISLKGAWRSAVGLVFLTFDIDHRKTLNVFFLPCQWNLLIHLDGTNWEKTTKLKKKNKKSSCKSQSKSEKGKATRVESQEGRNKTGWKGENWDENYILWKSWSCLILQICGFFYLWGELTPLPLSVVSSTDRLDRAISSFLSLLTVHDSFTAFIYLIST